MDPINVLNGQYQTYRPGTYVTWRAEDLPGEASLGANKSLGLIGEAEGGMPLGAYALSNASKARDVLRGGPLLEAALLAFQAAGNGGLTVVAVNVRGGTPAKVDLPGTANGSVFGTLTTASYRERANQTKVALFGSATAGYTLNLQDADTDYTLAANRLGLGLNIQYRGAGTAATAEIKAVAGQLSLVTTVTGATQDNLQIPLTNATSLSDLARLIQLSGPYAASPARDGRLLASDLDVTASPVNVLTAAVLTAVQADFVQFFRTVGGGEFTFALGAAATPAAAFSGFFSGGTSSAATPSNWSKSMASLSNVPLSLIVPLTADQTILAGLRGALVERNSAQASKFTMMIGGFNDALLPATTSSNDVNAYVQAVAAELTSTNNYQYQLVVTTGTSTLPGSGTRKQLPMYLVAALLAGEIIGQGANKSLTYRPIALSDAFPPLDQAQSDLIVRAGGLALETPVAGGSPRVIRDRTTYVGSNNPIYESGMSVRIMNSAARGMKAIQDRYIPGEASGQRLADFQSAATDYFDALVERGDLVADGVDANGQGVKPYDFKVQRTRSGGRHVISTSRVVPKGEFTVGEHSMVAQSVEFQITNR